MRNVKLLFCAALLSLLAAIIMPASVTAAG